MLVLLRLQSAAVTATQKQIHDANALFISKIDEYFMGACGFQICFHSFIVKRHMTTSCCFVHVRVINYRYNTFGNVYLRPPHLSSENQMRSTMINDSTDGSTLGGRFKVGGKLFSEKRANL